MAQIRLSDFGPIIKGYTENEGYIDFKKVTVFIGDQGMGKSTLAKLYSLFSWLEKAVYQGKLSEKELTGSTDISILIPYWNTGEMSANSTTERENSPSESWRRAERLIPHRKSCTYLPNVIF